MLRWKPQISPVFQTNCFLHVEGNFWTQTIQKTNAKSKLGADSKCLNTWVCPSCSSLTSLSARAGPLLLWGLLSVFVFSSGSPLSPWDAHKNRKTVGNLKQWVLWTDFEGTLLHHSPWMRVCAPTSGAQKCVVFAAPTLRSQVTWLLHT